MKQQPEIAIALKYEPGQTAPEVTALGRGEVAKRIVALAEAHGVPLVQDTALAQALIRVPLGFDIPPELYSSVAAILAYLYRLEQAAKR